MDLAQANTLGPYHLDERFATDDAIFLETAAGRVRADESAPTQIDDLFENVEPILLESTPSVQCPTAPTTSSGSPRSWPSGGLHREKELCAHEANFGEEASDDLSPSFVVFFSTFDQSSYL